MKTISVLLCLLAFSAQASQPWYTLRMSTADGAGVIERFIVGEEACKQRAASWMRDLLVWYPASSISYSCTPT